MNKLDKIYDSIMESDETLALWLKGIKDLTEDYRVEILTNGDAIQQAQEAEVHIKRAIACLIAAEQMQHDEDMVNIGIMREEVLNEGE